MATLDARLARRERMMPSRADRLERLATFPERVAEAARAASGVPVPDGEWTPEQVVRHLISVETEVHQARLPDLATESAPTWTWQEPGPWPGRPELDLAGLLALFAGSRAVTLATFRALDEAGWARTGEHATFGPLDAEGLLWLTVDHDEEHLRGLAAGTIDRRL
jgi:DinB superfamily